MTGVWVYEQAMVRKVWGMPMGRGSLRLPFFAGRKAFVGVDGLAGEGGEGVVGDSFDEACEGFEDGFVGDGLADEARGPAGEVFGCAFVALFGRSSGSMMRLGWSGGLGSGLVDLGST